ncbi:hypothetical protein GC173_11735 [bacterium]|nr:hypothetical protein [bacterium]
MGFLSKLFGKKDAPQAPPPAAKPAAQEEWSEGSSVPQELAASEALLLFNGEKPPVFLDVREEHELDAFGFIPNSIHIPMHEVQGRTDELDAARPVVVYCASGMRSMDVGFFLIQQGFKDVSNLNGGINAWPGPVSRRGQ